MMRVGLIKTMFKENERRLPIHPEYLHRFPRPLRARMVFEKTFGKDYGLADDFFTSLGCAVAERQEVFDNCELLVLPKPVPADLVIMKPGQVLFGWAHCVQQKEMTQRAIDRRLTVIAWEAMYQWSAAGERLVHVFYKNNEIAGYAAVLHCLQLLGIDGHYGPRKRVVVLGYGSVSRGAIYALQGRGFNNIHVFTRRPPYFVADQNPDVYYGQFVPEPDGRITAIMQDGSTCPLMDVLSDADIICNGVLQDVDHPWMFVPEGDTARLKPRSLVIDISCDEGMGFAFARPTTFDDPVFIVGGGSRTTPLTTHPPICGTRPRARLQSAFCHSWSR